MLCSIVEKIVLSGANSLDLLPLILLILYMFIGQAKDCVRVIKKVLRNEVEEVRNRY